MLKKSNMVETAVLGGHTARGWGLFLERPENFSGPNSNLSNCNPLALKSCSFNMFSMEEKPRGLRSLVA